MSYRQFMWGMSNGILVLTLAGGFWLGILGSTAARPELVGAVSVFGIASLLLGFVYVRRKSAGFRLAEMRNGTQEQRLSVQRIRRGLRWVILLELVMAAIAVGGCEYFHRADLIWPALGIAVSLHFVPLGMLFHVRPYYFTAAGGSIACLIALIAFTSPTNIIFASAAMCLNMWGTAAWMVVRSEAIADAAINPSIAAVAS